MVGNIPTQNQTTDEFLRSAVAEVRPLYIDDETIEELRAGGREFIGVRYFHEFFSPSEVSDEDAVPVVARQLGDFIRGCVVYESKALWVEEALYHYAHLPSFGEATSRHLSCELIAASIAEKKHKVPGYYNRHHRLRTTAKFISTLGPRLPAKLELDRAAPLSILRAA